MAISPSREFERAVRAHRATLDRLLDRRAVLGLRRYFAQAQDQLERILRGMAKGPQRAPVTPLQAQQLLRQVREAQQIIAARLAVRLTPVLREAQLEGVDETDDAVVKLEEDESGALLMLPLSETSTKQMLAERRSAKLEAANGAAWGKFSEAVASVMGQAAAVSLALGETPHEVIDRMRKNAEDNWWRAETIIHTEMAYAYNQAKADAIAEVAGAIPGLGKRWCELVDDATGLPLDDRVGNDSLVLHGQVVEGKGLFVMPPDPSVHPSFWNQAWDSSPNRPRDRSVTMPWKESWGVPGWRWVNNQRVPVNQRA